jgi:acetate kinase
MSSTSPLTLVVNCGSSSLKFALYDPSESAALISGLAECLGAADARIRYDADGQRTVQQLNGGGHREALDALLAFVDARGLLSRVAAVGHRVVHGGERFTRSVAITPEVLAGIEACSELAPLHNPANLIGIRAAMAALPQACQVAVFDTAFHQTMPTEAYLYALPQQYRRDYGVRRYGFHGTSHRYVSHRTIEQLGLDPKDNALVVLHLGNGASATAILNGQSVDTSMGLTPVEGLVMGTRCGDVDAGALLYIARRAGLDLDGVDTLINKRSGLLGLSELSNDCRTLETAAQEGHEGAKTALDVFCYRIARTVGALAAALPRLDAVVFTGGIGENSAHVRAAVLKRLAIFGLDVDEARNASVRGGASGIVSHSTKPCAIVVPTDEEGTIARDTAAIAFAQPGAAQ